VDSSPVQYHLVEVFHYQQEAVYPSE
jgi:hypothetical protein